MEPGREEPWFDRAFGPAYDLLYPHRDDDDARADVLRVAAAGIAREGRLLDLCCGSGRHLAALRAAGYVQLVGLDRSQHLLGQARARLGTQSLLVRGDLRHLPFADASFRSVLNLFTSFGYFDDDGEHLLALSEVRRVLEAGGRFHLDHVDRDALAASLVSQSEETRGGTLVRVTRRLAGKRVEKRLRADDGSIDHHESVRLWTRAELTELLASAGFDDVRVEAVRGRLHAWARRG